MATTRKTAARKAAPKAAPKAPPKAATNPMAAMGMPDMPGFAEAKKMMEKFKLPGIDVAAIVESQKKDMEALAEANRQAYEGIKALAKRRNEILMESLAQWQAAMKDAGGRDGFSKQAELARTGMQKAMDNMRELAEMEAKSRSKAWKVVQDRFQENLSNLQKLLQPK